MGFPMTLQRVLSRNPSLIDAAKDDIRRLAEDSVTLERARIRAPVMALLGEGCGGWGCADERADERGRVLAIINGADDE